MSLTRVAVVDANTGLEEYDFAKATTAIYSFFLYDLCDNYLEMSKPVFEDKSSAAAKASQAVLHTCLEQGFRLLHPFMPFVTEELWQRLARSAGDADSIMIAPYPTGNDSLADEAAEGWFPCLLSRSTCPTSKT